MKIEIDEGGNLILKEVFNPIILETDDGEKLAIVMRDSGFELDYMSKQRSSSFELKNGDIVPA